MVLALPVVALAALHLSAAPGPDELVDVARAVPGIQLDLRYATADNFLREAVYPCGRCLLRRPAAEALARAQAALAEKGLGLRVWDCYRPPAVQRKMWALVPDARYVANPAKGSIHNRGAAVDLTLVDAEGRALTMPTAFDDFSAAAAAEAPASTEAARNRATLRAAMEAAGFAGIRSEWWHFDLARSRGAPLIDAPLCPDSPTPPTR
jgi:D-alanyl-D-alanine dipeptidase